MSKLAREGKTSLPTHNNNNKKKKNRKLSKEKIVQSGYVRQTIW
jgi:hypothetical protein